jgi:MFS family permease
LLFAMPALMPGIMGYTPKEAIVAQNVLLVVLSCGLLFIAWLGDKVPRRYLLGFGALLTVLFAHGWFVAADARSIPLPLLGVIAALAASFYSGSFAAIAADLFPTRIRFSGIAVVLNVSFSLFSGIAPLVATTLVKATGSPASAGWYMAGCAGLTLIASLFVHRYDGMLKQMVRDEPV